MEENLPQTPSNNSQWKLLFVAGLLVILAGIGGFYASQKLSQPQKSTELATAPTLLLPTNATTISIAPEEESKTKWVRTKILGIISFEYPYGWHVASLWPDTSTEGIRVVVDPDPINTAPRGGSLDDLNVVVISGIPNPEEKLQEKIIAFKKDLQNPVETQINGAAGKITHIKGTANVYEELKQVEAYFLLVPAQNPTDKINYQVISASIGNESKKAPVLKRIMESIKKEY